MLNIKDYFSLEKNNASLSTISFEHVTDILSPDETKNIRIKIRLFNL